jgi:putative SOS response-associated peptidase YedK
VCGRFVSSSSPERIAEYFGAVSDVESLGENYNVAPTNDIYAVVMGSDGVPHVRAFHWGLIPAWAKDRKVGAKMINARAETLGEKPAYKSIFKKTRCLVPMDGFYEWAPGTPDGPRTAKGQPAKRPMYVHRPDGEPLAVAGLWSAWRDKTAGPDAEWLHSATVVTTSANGTMSPIHDRMPVILPRSAWATWLDPTVADPEVLGKLLVPASDDLLVVDQVSTDVNNVRNRGPELVEPIDPVD